MKEMMTVKDVSEFLGIGINQTYCLVRRDDFPKLRINRQYIIPSDKLKNWIDENLNKPITL